MSTKPLDPVSFLLVDDLEENLLALEGLLRRVGLTLLKAKSGPEALEILLKTDVALALVDVQMPGMNGFELAEFMRGSERTKNVPIIFLTAANADQQRRFRGYEAGAVDFLQKPVEADILRSKAGIFFELYRKRQETQRYAEALKEADRRKDDFLATLAHELRNPLAPIRNGLQILRMSPDNKAAEEIRDMMDRQLTHMVHLIDDLLDISRISKGKIELRRERVTLQNVLESAIEASKPQIEAGRHHLVLDVPESPIWIDGDLTRLAQIVGNLLNNAAKYTYEPGQIRLSAKRDGAMVIVEVADNGIGIAPAMQSKIFELFMQVDNTVKHAQGGLGIGLALVKHLVEMHKGAIEVRSAGEGKGSIFTVRLPIAAELVQQEAIRPANPVADPVANPTANTTEKLRILVVDDNIESAKTTGWMLEMIGHEPSLAHDGPEGLAAARTIKPDVILLDIGLPGMSGYDVCRELRKDPAFQNTKIVAQTGWGQKKDRDMARDAGFDHHLVKPVKLEEVEHLLSVKGRVSV